MSGINSTLWNIADRSQHTDTMPRLYPWINKKSQSFNEFTYTQDPAEVQTALANIQHSKLFYSSFQPSPFGLAWQTKSVDKELSNMVVNCALKPRLKGSITVTNDDNLRLQSFETQKVAIRKILGNSLGMNLAKIGNEVIFAFVDKDLPVAQAGIGFGDVLIGIEGCCSIEKCSTVQVLKFIKHFNPGDIYLFITPRKFEIEMTATIKTKDVVFTDKTGTVVGVQSLCLVAKTRQVSPYHIIAIDNVNVLVVEDKDFIDELTKRPGTPRHMRLMPSTIAKRLLIMCKSVKNKQNAHLAGARNIQKP